MKRMTPRQRARAALRREPVDQVPFMYYLPDGEDGRRMRELGCGIWSQVPVMKQVTPNVTYETVEYEENGARYRRTTAGTPVGEVYATWRLSAAYGSDWCIDHYIKRPDDYKPVEFIVNDTDYEPAYDEFSAHDSSLGEEGFTNTFWGFSPLLEMEISLMGIERFSEDLLERPDLFFSLYEALCRQHRKAFPIYVNSPAEHLSYCGNCVPEVLGDLFAKYCLPLYDELGEMAHEKGKTLGCHLDANNAFWAAAIARSQLDVIEAFTPAPDTDMTMADACAAWPEKAYLVNFPSSVHLGTTEQVKDVTRRILTESAPGTGVIMSVTEDIPPQVGNRSIIDIAEVLAELGGMS